jgi:hypothetical protein
VTSVFRICSNPSLSVWCIVQKSLIPQVCFALFISITHGTAEVIIRGSCVTLCVSMYDLGNNVNREKGQNSGCVGKHVKGTRDG